MFHFGVFGLAWANFFAALIQLFYLCAKSDALRFHLVLSKHLSPILMIFLATFLMFATIYLGRQFVQPVTQKWESFLHLFFWILIGAGSYFFNLKPKFLMASDENHCFIGLFENNFVMKVNRANQLYTVRGFTLIELMIVILVIGIVGGIIFSGAGYLFEKQSIKTAQAEIEILKIALNEYHRKEGEALIDEKSTDFKDFSGDLLKGLYGSHEFEDGSWERLDEEDKKKFNSHR